MIRVLLVDDEPLSISLMKKVIRWEKYEMCVAGTAYNGENALEFIQKEPVDIVFTDIKMPHMDGIELVKRVKKYMPQIQFVIVSSYSDFTLVKESFQYGVTDYILKVDIDNEEITDSLLERLRQKSGAANLAGGEAADKPVFSELSIPYDERDRYAYCMLSIHFTAPVLPLHITECLYSLRENAGDFCYTLIDNQILVLVFSRDAETAADSSQFLARHILDYLQTVPAAERYCIGCSGIQPYSRYLELFAQAEEAVSYQFYYPSYHFFEYKQTSGRLYAGNLSQIQEHLKLPVYQIDMETLSVCCMHLFQNAKDARIQPGRLIQDVVGLCDRIEADSLITAKTCENIMELQSCFQGILYRNLFVKSYQIPDMKSRIDSYLEINYVNPELTISVMAADLGMSKRQLSIYFSREKGVHFKQYLNNIRIQHACELFTYTFLRVNEVAEKVGYASTEHFSRIFTGIKGESPAKYAQNCRHHPNRI